MIRRTGFLSEFEPERRFQARARMPDASCDLRPGEAGSAVQLKALGPGLRAGRRQSGAPAGRDQAFEARFDFT